MRHLASALVGLALLAVPLGGCARRSPPPLSFQSLRTTRQFHDFTVFWVGRRFEGIPLTAADRPKDYAPSQGMRLYYGDCAHHAFSTGGCTLPLEINTVLYKAHSNVGLGKQRSTRVRGVPAVIYDGGKSIELYTGNLAIDVFADNPGRALRAARALRPRNDVGPPGPGLPQPNYVPDVRGT
jgi:hypothetical protein